MDSRTSLLWTVGPLYYGHIGTTEHVLNREVSLLQRLKLYNNRIVLDQKWHPQYRGFPFMESPDGEVPLYCHIWERDPEVCPLLGGCPFIGRFYRKELWWDIELTCVSA